MVFKAQFDVLKCDFNNRQGVPSAAVRNVLCIKDIINFPHLVFFSTKLMIF